MSGKDWVAWHRQYDTDPGRARRLREVQRLLTVALERSPTGPIRVVAACAGSGRDVLGALATHPRAKDVQARLIEIDPRLLAEGRAEAERLGLRQVRFWEGDAAEATSYEGFVPAEVVMFCGVFGNLTDEDVRRVVLTMPELCAPHAFAVWTRHRQAPDLTVSIRGWFREAGFHEVEFVPLPDSPGSVGLEQLLAAPRPVAWTGKLFSFLPDRAPAKQPGRPV